MAKAVFHRNQKVWVETVGTFAVIDKITPVWAKGFDEPVRITYDVGLGREFLANELRAEEVDEAAPDESVGEWRMLRAKNKWQDEQHCIHHPFPGTFPVVVTDPNDWGGWRTPGAEYDRDPYRIEQQARIIASAPRLMTIARALSDMAADDADDLPPAIVKLARQAASVLQFITEEPVQPVHAVPIALAS